MKKYLFILVCCTIIFNLYSCSFIKQDEETIKENNIVQVESSSNQKKKEKLWKSMDIILNGQQLILPFSYEKLDNQYKILYKNELLEDNFIIDAKERTYSIMQLKSITQDYSVYVAFSNEENVDKPIENCNVWSLKVIYNNETKQPMIALPGNITWGASIEEIQDAYGIPQNKYYSELLKYWSYDYTSDFSYSLHLVIDDEKGLQEIKYSIY